MIEFYQTRLGKQYYEQTLPKIANALKKIAGAISAPTTSIHISQDVPKDFLAELYWGNYDPSGESDSEESARRSAEISAAQEAVKVLVSPEVWAQLDNLFALIAQRNDLDRAEAYAIGFRSAVTMLAAGLSRTGNKETA